MKEKLTITKDGFFLSGKPYYLASGDIHYFRIYPTEWRRHLLLAKDFGLNTIQTYVPWNLHEPEKGKFDFSGHLDLCAFLELAGGMGFKVLLRPSPFPPPGVRLPCFRKSHFREFHCFSFRHTYYPFL